jgi:competence protein ComFC
MKTNPLSMTGPWDVGLSLDAHTLSAEFLGYDSAGHPQFDTKRSDVGEALFQAKYRANKPAAVQLAVEAAKHVRRARIDVDIVVPVPPSKARTYQPLLAIAKRLAAELEVEFDGASLRKVKETPELKSMDDVGERKKALSGAFEVAEDGLRGRRVLLLDDLYRSGASMAAAARVLKKPGRAAFIAAVALTRTRTRS